MRKIDQVLALLQQDQKGVKTNNWNDNTPSITSDNIGDKILLFIEFKDAYCSLAFDATGDKFLGICNWKD